MDTLRGRWTEEQTDCRVDGLLGGWTDGWMDRQTADGPRPPVGAGFSREQEERAQKICDRFLLSQAAAGHRAVSGVQDW